MLEEDVDEGGLVTLGERNGVEEIDLPLGEGFVDEGGTADELEAGQVERSDDLAREHGAQLLDGVGGIREGVPEEQVVGMRGHRGDSGLRV